MPLSRHFYPLDDVEAALFYTTSHGLTNESLFWCKELIQSDCTSESISILFRSWLWNIGAMHPQWLIDTWATLAAEELEINDILLATYQLASTPYKKRDNSLWSILVLLCIDNKMPDRVTRKTPRNNPFNDEKELYFVRALFQGKAHSACWIACHIDTERIWIILEWISKHVYSAYSTQYSICFEALKGYDKLLGYKNNEYDIIMKLMGIIIICNRIDIRLCVGEKQMDKYSVELCQEMDRLTDRIQRRMYVIPKHCLYGATSRGKTNWVHNNLSELYNVEKNIIGCPYWDEILTKYGDVNEKGDILWNSPESMEEFYNTSFPDDIPDEWTKKEKEKSHGDGLLAPHENIAIWKYTKALLPPIGRQAWNPSKCILAYLKTIEFDNCADLEQIVAKFKPCVILMEEDLKKLRPVHKIKII